MRLRRTLAGALTAPLLLLAACGGDQTSVADPPVSPASTSSSPTAPPRETPEHFIRRWAEAEKNMENTGDTHKYLGMSRGCMACSVLARTVTRYYSRGGYIRWNGWKIRSIGHYPSSGHSLSFAVSSVSAPTTYKTSSTSTVRHLGGGPITYVLTLSPTSGPYHVSAKAQLDQ